MQMWPCRNGVLRVLVCTREEIQAARLWAKRFLFTSETRQCVFVTGRASSKHFNRYVQLYILVFLISAFVEHEILVHIHPLYSNQVNNYQIEKKACSFSWCYFHHND